MLQKDQLERKFRQWTVKFIVEETIPESFDGIDIAFFSAGGDISKMFAEEAVTRGAVVIDNTSAFRMTEDNSTRCSRSECGMR